VTSKVREIISHLTVKPNTIFLIDSLGALLTALSLFVVLRNFNEYFGMPITILTCLSVIAACLCIYSMTCFFCLKENYVPFLRAISICNLLYCILTLALIIVYYPMLTVIGIAYFFIEIAIVCGLVYIEHKVATAISKVD